MLTSKSAATAKQGAKAASKTAAGKPAILATSRGARGGGANKGAAPKASPPPMRSERSLFSVLLAQSGPSSDMEMVNLVCNRLPLSVIDRLLAEGVSKQEIDLVAPPRTLAHRRANAENLTVDESDRAVRLARVVAQTESVFGDKDKAMAWLRRPMTRFEGRTPIEMLVTDVGSRLVEEVLVQIDEGFFA